MNGSTSSRSRLAAAISRWANVLLLAVLGSVTFEVALPFAWNIAKARTIPFSAPFVALLALLATSLLVYVVAEPIRIRRGQWRRLLWYPSTWLAVPLACGLAVLAERLPAPVRPYAGLHSPDWQHVWLVGPVGSAVAIGLFLRQLPWRRRGAPGNARVPEVGTEFTWNDIERWISAGERPLTRGEMDLFQHQRIADRIVKQIAVDRRNVGLLGRFGSGKTSILNLVTTALSGLAETIVVADFDVWAVPDPADVPRLALNRIINVLDDHVDTIRFRGLPLAYQRLASAEPSGRLSAILAHENAGDSLEVLQELSGVLTPIGARVLLVVQDLERAGSEFDTRHLQRLLWALRDVDGIQFLLLVDPEHAIADCPKLCDSIELVPPVEVEHVARLLKVAYDHWRTKFDDIDPHPDRRRDDKLRLDVALAGDMAEYLRRTGRDTPLDALVALLDTPRALKHVLRRVDDSWNNLHGEAELADIIAVSALRHGAEPAYRFLLSNIDPARHEPDDMFPKTKEIKDEWASVLQEVPSPSAVQVLVDLLGVKQLTENGIRSTQTSPQDVSESEPVDYFRRIVAEGLSPAELQDQTVLRDIDEWKNSRSGPLLERVAAATETDDEYVRVWEHFSIRHTEAELIELVDGLVSRLKERDGRTAAADHRGLIGLWRRCNRRLQRNQHAEWLRGLILGAIPVSLHLATGLYYYWTGNHGIVDDARREDIRRSIVDKVRATFRSGSALAKVLTPREPYMIGRLITQTGADRRAEAFEEWKDYLPNLLLDGSRTDPDVIVPEIANLVGDEQSGIVAAGNEYPPIFINRYAIDRARMTAVFGERVDEVLNVLASYQGNDAYAARARDAAKVWLDEQRPVTERAVAKSDGQSL